MKKPERAPSLAEVFSSQDTVKDLLRVPSSSIATIPEYIHWDKLRRRKLQEGVTHMQMWGRLKLDRAGSLKPIPLLGTDGLPFQFCVPSSVQEALHKIDSGGGGWISFPEQITNPQTRDRYLIRSMIEESITSSQLEGAATTREVAKELIRTNRAPQTKGEQMIVNNYATMQKIKALKDEKLTPDMVFGIHREVTFKTLKDESKAGTFRSADDNVYVGDDYGEVFHEPPHASTLEHRLDQMCAFANGDTPGFFIHPVLRAIMLHFWLAYDHPFVDGIGRTARALFYWKMLNHGYWLFEYISISQILLKAPAKYYRSFLYTETDENDLTYFVDAQTRVIQKAILDLHDYLDRKTKEFQDALAYIRGKQHFNHRQIDLLRHALKHPYHRYTIQGHMRSHGIVYQTARTDLLELNEMGLVTKSKLGRALTFTPMDDIQERLRELGKGRQPAQKRMDGK